MMLQSLLKNRIKVGNLTVAFAGGQPATYGDGSGPPVSVKLSAIGARGIALHPPLGLGEAYMNGEPVIEQGDIWDLMEMVGRNYSLDPDPIGPLKRFMQKLQKARQQLNDRASAREDGARHY